MTILESLREPITVQGLVCLTVGIFIGITAMVVPLYVFQAFGPPMECQFVKTP